MDGTETTLTLSPARDVHLETNGFVASSSEPWLLLSCPTALIVRLLLKRFVELRYRINAEAEVTRPLLRFWTAEDVWEDTVLPAAGEGQGIWRGCLPKGVQRIWISPAMRPGPFSFQIDVFAPLPWRERVRFAIASPRRAFYAGAAAMVGLEDEASLNRRWVYGRAETQNYARWRHNRQIPAPELSKAPQTSVKTSDLIRQFQPVSFIAQGGSASTLASTYESLRRQNSHDWRLLVLDPTLEGKQWLCTQDDYRLLDHEVLPVEGFIAFIEPGDRLAEGALACLQAHIETHPEHDVIYVDEAPAITDPSARPIFKPDWSPIRQAFAPYVGRAAFMRATLIDADDWAKPTPEEKIHAVLSRANAVGHIRRFLWTCGQAVRHPASKTGISPSLRDASALVSVIIPTRDRADLLEPCLVTLLEKTAYSSFEVFVVDNGSVEPKTHALFKRLQQKESRLRIMPHPGPFNFSALSNFGARQSKGTFLLFLNNDTEIIDPDWMDNLVGFASQPTIGAVGAKLLYPDLKVQHVGVTLGHGSVAGHFGAGISDDAPGWLGNNFAPHETAAVTGACLMVERWKFDAVGGFDAQNLPIDLNDIDLCLRLLQRGWRTICDTRSTLLHRESASRGGSGLRLQKVYQKERSYFKNRWRNYIRDDPYFNPQLSLYDFSERLG